MVLALQETIGNAAVAGILQRQVAAARRPVVIQRGYDTSVRDAIHEKSYIPFSEDGDYKKAWGVLNSLSMSDMLTTIEALNKTGDLAKLLSHSDKAKQFNLARLMIAVHSVQLKAAGVDQAGLTKIGSEISAAGGEASAVETYLSSGPAMPPGFLTGINKPDAATVDAVDAVLNPGSVKTTVVPSTTSAPPTTVNVSVPWDGDGPTPAHKKKAKALKRELTAALARHLGGVIGAMRKLKKAPKIPMERVEGAGKQSKRVVDDVFGSLATSAALTSGQSTARSSFGFNKDVDLFDISKTRTPDAADLASWIAESDAAASAIQLAHNFDKTRSKEAAFLDAEILKPFVAANKADLEIYDVFGFAITDTKGQKVVTLPPESRPSKKKPGTPSDHDRASLWGEWQVLAHEYIHTLEHPAFNAAAQGRRALIEGFCELFTKAVLTKFIPIAQADSDAALRGGVEGVDSAGKPFAGFTPKLVGNYSSGAYSSYVAQAEAIRAKTSEEAVRAAFFHGHVELIGLDPDGSKLKTPNSGKPSGPVISPPKGVTTVFELGMITKTSTAAILAANPPLKADSPLPGSVVVPGCQLHTVVESQETGPGGRVFDHRSENGGEIAKLYGFTEKDLALANPGLNLATLAAGTIVLIPSR